MTTSTKSILLSVVVALSLATTASTDIPDQLPSLNGGLTDEKLREGLLEVGFTDITHLSGEGNAYTARAY